MVHMTAFCSARKLAPIFLTAVAEWLAVCTMGHAGNVIPGYGINGVPFTGDFHWLVIACHGSDDSSEPASTSYFKKLFTTAGKGTMNMVDWWHDVSYGQLSIEGTEVAAGSHADSKGWYTLSITKAAYDKLSRTAQVQACANAGSVDYNLSNYYGVLTVFPATDNAAQPGGDADDYGPISVTLPGVNGSGGGTFTLSLVNLPSDANETFLGHEMGHGFGLHHSRLLSTSTLGYGDGYDIMSAMGVYSLTPPSSDPKNVAYGGSNLGSVAAAKGPGPDAVTLGDEDWIPINRSYSILFQRQQTIYLHALGDPDALTDSKTPAAGQTAPDSGEYLQAFVPTQTSFPFSPATTNCNKTLFYLEYREPTRWDAGLPTPASYWSPTDSSLQDDVTKSDFPTGTVLLHVTCTSNWNPPPPNYLFSLLVDQEPQGGGYPLAHNSQLYSNDPPGGAFYPGDEFATKSFNFYFAVNSMSNDKHRAAITYTINQGKIEDKLTLTSPTESGIGSYSAAAKLETTAPNGGDTAAVPGHVVVFKLGSEKCQAVTGFDGAATCDLKASGSPFSKLTFTASADSTTAYKAADAKGSVTLTAIILKPIPVKLPMIKFKRPPPPILPRRCGV